MRNNSVARAGPVTQEIVLSGDHAVAYDTQLEAGLGSNLETDMKRIAADMVSAESQSKRERGN